MNKKQMNREEVEDRMDCEKMDRILNDPDDEVVDWEQAKDEIHRWRKENSRKVDSGTSRSAVGAG